jgi:hypothetical protein
MEALENSAKLSDSVEALSKFPGLSAITSFLTAKSDSIRNEENRKVEEGLALQETIEGVEKKPTGPAV